MRSRVDLRTREKILKIVLILKDICVLLIGVFVFNVLFCICVKNAWFSPLIPYRDINKEDFWLLFKTFLMIIPFVMLFRGICGKYAVHLREVAIVDSYGKAKLQRFRLIK